MKFSILLIKLVVNHGDAHCRQRTLFLENDPPVFSLQQDKNHWPHVVSCEECVMKSSVDLIRVQPQFANTGGI